MTHFKVQSDILGGAEEKQNLNGELLLFDQLPVT
jgi:hypothetical protein